MTLPPISAQALGRRLTTRLLLFASTLLGMAAGCGRSAEPDPVPARLTGGSMAPALLGEHFRVDCPGCGITLAIDAMDRPADDHAVCGHCGETGLDLVDRPVFPGAAVLIDPLAWHDVQRWDLVAFAHPDRADEFAVKRVIGLPGETVRLERGELWMDGELVRKSFAEQLRTRILVQDSLYHNAARRPRWYCADSAWRYDHRDRSLVTLVDATSEAHWPRDFDYLQYVHYRCVRSRRVPADPQPVEDDYWYNQAITRSLNPVIDLMVELQVSCAKPLRLIVEFRDGDSWNRFDIDEVEGSLTIYRDGQSIHQSPFSYDADAPQLLTVSCFDRRLIVAMADRPLASVDLDVHDLNRDPPRRNAEDRPSGGVPLRIANRHPVSLERIRVFRDLHYFTNERPGGDAVADPPAFRVPAGALFVVGDNVPVSVDSRHWDPVEVNRESLVGRVRLSELGPVGR